MVALIAALVTLLAVLPPLAMAQRWAAREEVAPEWLPFATLTSVACLVGSVWVPALENATRNQAEVAVAALAVTHFTWAGWLLFAALGQAQIAGSRASSKRRRTTNATFVGIAAATLPAVTLVPPTLVVLVPAALAAWMWVKTANVRGSEAVERRRVVSAGLLVAAAAQIAVFAAHVWVGFDLDEPRVLGSLGLSIGVGSAAVVVLVAGLRFLVRAIPATPVLASLATGLTLLVPQVWWASRAPLPDDIPAIPWVDLRGNPGPRTPAAYSARCPWRPTGKEPGCYTAVVVGPPSVPLDEVPDHDIIVEGSRRLPSWARRRDDDLHVREADGDALVDLGQGQVVRMPLGPPLQDLLELHPRRPLVVHRTHRWTLGDFARICASTGPDPGCTIARGD
ncbi:MAG: hypothetical protein H6734_13600 [Alphaproteobacteria bacterium]|nr:hypothetical protein [Alphaproteobacteria bacterium]